MSNERLIDIVDNEWRNDKLPNEDIQLPLDKLPDPEDSENQTMKEVVSANRHDSLSCDWMWVEYFYNSIMSFSFRRTSGLILL